MTFVDSWAGDNIVCHPLQILKGLHYLHNCKPPIVHRDMKIENLLLSCAWNTSAMNIAHIHTYCLSVCARVSARVCARVCACVCMCVCLSLDPPYALRSHAARCFRYHALYSVQTIFLHTFVHVYYTASGDIKIVDYGVARYIDTNRKKQKENLTRFVGSRARQ